jgi:Cu/Ag efflux protein CusF
MTPLRKTLGGAVLVLITASVMVLGCGDGSTQPKNTKKIYEFKGTVTGVDMAKKAPVTIDHEDIPGLMQAMKMSFSVENAKVLEGIKQGDAVHGKLKVKDGDYIITELHKK